MPSRSAINVSLTRQLNQFIDQLVESGRYQSASEVVRDGLRLLQDHEAKRAAAAGVIRRLVAEGAKAAARGDLHDSGDVFAEWDRLDRAARRRKSA